MKVVDMHCDTISELLRAEDEGNIANLRDNDFDIDIKKMIKGDYLLQNFAMFVPYGGNPNPEKDCLRLIDKYYREIEANIDSIRPVFSYQDIEDNMNEGKMSAMLTLEEGGVVFNDLAMLRNYYRLGVRMITLTWNFPNGIGYPNFVPKNMADTSIDRYSMLRTVNETDGLTPFGIEYIKEMERLGIIIDVSHLGDKGFYDVFENTTKPFVASHSNARSVQGVARNLKDDMIRKLASRGGVMGINYCTDFIDDEGGSIEGIIKHIDHIVSIAGIDCIGLGSDFDGIKKRDELSDASKMNDLRVALAKHGYSGEDIDKIFYKNVLRVYKEVLR